MLTQPLLNTRRRAQEYSVHFGILLVSKDQQLPALFHPLFLLLAVAPLVLIHVFQAHEQAKNGVFSPEL